MQINLNIPDASAAQIVDGVCRATGFTAGSGLTKGQWAKGKVIEYIKSTAKRGLQMDSADSIKTTIDPVSIT